ncbi:hypothetical protein DFH27DRAFT_528603 [Peziza echinospora]|nr:hypothetical protein DFH27DRAFT_528603 [Peziza echinospora]
MSSEHNPDTMDYAAAAARNSEQSAEEVIPTTETTNLVDVDSGSVNVVPADFLEQEIQTSTQAQRIALEEVEAEAAAAAAADRIPKPKKKKSTQTSTSAALAAIKPYLPRLEVVNAILGGAATVALGIAAWRRYRVGDVSWKTAGLWTGVVAAVAAVDALGLRFFQQSQKNTKAK